MSKFAVYFFFYYIYEYVKECVIVSVNSVSSTNLLQNVNVGSNSPQQPSVLPAEQQTAYVASEIVSKEAGDASKAYASQNIKRFVAPPETVAKSLPEYKQELMAQGKVEGQDFEVSQDDVSSSIRILKDGKPSQIMRFDKRGDSKEDLESIEYFGYPINDTGNGLKYTSTVRGPKGEFHFRTTVYDKDNNPYKDPYMNSQSDIPSFTTALKNDNVQYAHDINFVGDNIIRTTYTIVDPQTKNFVRYEFLQNKEDSKILSRSKEIFLENDKSESVIRYDDDHVDYVEYKDNMLY